MGYYFDHNATTPVSAEVFEAMAPMFREGFGNASSIHAYGQAARARVEAARQQTAALFGCRPKEVVFTSGGTEGDNLAVFGVLRRGGAAGKHAITSTIEHPAVLNACAQLEREGAAVTYLPVDAGGRLDPQSVRAALRPETALVSVMHANNETGVIQEIGEIGRICREAGTPFHSDGVQAAGKLAVDVQSLGVDLYSISGHKLYATKGVGALYVREGVKLQAQQFGGRHERERRAGTENTAGIVALGAACAWAMREGAGERERLAALRDRLERAILEGAPQTRVNGGGAPRTPNTLNLSFAGIDGEALVIALDLAGFAVSTGAACSSGAIAPSHVLLALGLSAAEARGSLRISLGRGNDEAQAEALGEAIVSTVERLRKLSPAYENA